MNPMKGEVSFEAGGKTYVFKLGTHAQVLLEKRAGMSWQKFWARPGEDFSTEDGVIVMWAGLNRKHDLSEDQVADLIDVIGEARVAEIVKEAILAASPKNAEAAKGSARPPRQAKATGTRQ
jgi:hypothetical protein